MGVLALALVVAACGSSGGSSSSTETETTGGTETTSGSGSGGETVANVPFTGFEKNLPKCYSEPTKEPLTIGYASPTLVNEATATEAKVIKLEAERLGGTVIMEDAGGEPDKQVSDLQRLISRGVKALIVFPLDAKALGPVLGQAKKAGIPVIGITANNEGPNPGPGFNSQVLERAGEAGYVQAKKMAELVPKGSEIGQINLAFPVAVIEYLIAQGKHWAEEFGLKPVALTSNPNDEIAGGETAMTGLLGQAPNIAGVMAYNDESATGAYAAARQQGKKVALIGNNGGALAYTSIESGKIDASAQYQVVGIASCAVKGAFDLAQGKKVPQAVAPSEVKLLDKETIAEVPSWEEQIKEQFGKSE
ncbi:MAG: sugar ABC transporter substrate-binding protein [Actinobacteria bacterium]|nr:sugar ABC transporter substrate-binding protein [Actinomycetota bacterium]